MGRRLCRFVEPCEARRIAAIVPPADFRFDKTKADYWRGRSEEARVFAEGMSHTQSHHAPHRRRIREDRPLVRETRRTEDRQRKKDLGQGANQLPVMKCGGSRSIWRSFPSCCASPKTSSWTKKHET